MKGEIYIANANSPEDHLSNAIFQAENVYGWLRSDRENALIKAHCLLDSAELLVATLEAEARKGGKHAA